MDTDMICEAHPEYGWPHDDCPGPGMPHPIITALRSRVRELEKYSMHKSGCLSFDVVDHTDPCSPYRPCSCGLAALLTTPTKKVMPFMLPAPMPATPIPPDPRDAVVEAAEFLVLLPAGAPSEEATERYEALVRAVRALRTTEDR